jgi:hypothetical protein
VDLPVPQWYGGADEIADDAESTPQASRALDVVPAAVLTPEELAFLGANLEVG